MAIDISRIDAPPDLLFEAPPLPLENSRVAEVGARGAGRRLPPATRDLLKGSPFVVDFCDPSPTTTLHAGYLRNIALGHALAGTLEAAGAHVARQTQIADAGRDMGDAMAGYVRFADESDPAAAGEKSDRFVGRLYSHQVQGSTSDDGLVDLLLSLLASGDGPTRELWHAVRDWAVS